VLVLHPCRDWGGNHQKQSAEQDNGGSLVLGEGWRLSRKSAQHTGLDMKHARAVLASPSLKSATVPHEQVTQKVPIFLDRSPTYFLYNMQPLDQQDQRAPVSHGIEAAPPAYSQQPATEPHGGAVVDQPPAPVKHLPTDLHATQGQFPASAATKAQAPGVVPLNQLGEQPQWIDCPFCQRRTVTRLSTEGTPMQM
jgi:hypothetical protein